MESAKDGGGRGGLLCIKDISCWKCGGAMRVAWATRGSMDGSGQGGEYLFPRSFDRPLFEAAAASGVAIKKVHSKTTGEDYEACICTRCGAFVGESFLFGYVYEQDEEIEVGDQ